MLAWIISKVKKLTKSTTLGYQMTKDDSELPSALATCPACICVPGVIYKFPNISRDNYLLCCFLRQFSWRDHGVLHSHTYTTDWRLYFLHLLIHYIITWYVTTLNIFHEQVVLYAVFCCCQVVQVFFQSFPGHIRERSISLSLPQNS